MRTKLFQEYLAFFQKDFVHVRVLNDTTLEIRGVQHPIQKKGFENLIEALICTEFIEEVDYTYVQKLYQAMQKASLGSMILFDRCVIKSKEAIDVFVELVATEVSIRQFDKKLKVINS
ncbi:MAG: hypothetical protein J0647_01510 [Campylobacteraceae bacterium]|nr:hypothetical protein [Campylobacteraceae bacterium]